MAAEGAAAALREAGHRGEIVIAGAEADPPYQRPPLSKEYLAGEMPRERLRLRSAGMYRDLGVELRLGVRAVELDLERRRVALESGPWLGYDLLLIATGARPRRLAGFETAVHLREIADCDRLRALLRPGGRLDIVGAGFIGSEVASAAVRKGTAVTVREALAQPLEAALGPEVGAWLADIQREHGVDLRTSAADLPDPGGDVLVAVGSEPNSELAAAAGLPCAAGVLVDEQGRTAVEGVFAAGDVTRFKSPVFGESVRVEHFQTAARQGAAVGRAMAGVGEPFAEVPWFWSHQFGLSLEYAGAGLRFDRSIARGTVGRPPFAVFQLRAGRLVGVFAAGDHHTVSQARRLIASGITPAPEALADPGFDLRRPGRS